MILPKYRAEIWTWGERRLVPWEEKLRTLRRAAGRFYFSGIPLASEPGFSHYIEDLIPYGSKKGLATLYPVWSLNLVFTESYTIDSWVGQWCNYVHNHDFGLTLTSRDAKIHGATFAILSIKISS